MTDTMALSGAADDRPPPSWRQRPRPIGAEMVYRLDGDALTVDSGRRLDRVALSAVEQVRFEFKPNSLAARGYRTSLTLSDGRKLGFGSLSWRSLTDLDRDEKGYHAFVSALAARIARANPRARFVGGRPAPLWWMTTVVGLIALAMLAWFTLRAFSQGLTTPGLLGVVLMAASLWQVLPMIRLNRPRELRTGEVPPELVPGGPSS